jgi:hypothetical protein
MTTTRTREYLFVPDVEALRAKIARASGTAAYLWRNIQALPYAAGNGRYYPAFLYLVTGKDEYARAALAALHEALAFYHKGDLSIDVHFHTWCNSAPMARLAVMYDWIADSPVVTAADHAAIREAMLDYTLKHPYNIAKSRTRTFDNQISAMSFCCALVGYLFGVKRGSDLRAQRLLDAGIMRFPDIFALSPKGGYSFEGSTYFCQIVAPVVSWYTALMEQITGQALFTRPFPPSDVSPEEVLRTYHKLVGPSGLMPPWDHYGWMRCASTMGLAYLARQTGDPAPLVVLERLALGAEPGYIAWGSDDRLWTLIWWPDDLSTDGVTEPFPSWAIPNVGGALVEPAQAWRLFQAWDECAPTVYCGRAQVNPNIITLDCWGSPLFTDGTPTTDGCPLFDYPIEAFRDMLAPGELESITDYYRTFIPGWEPSGWVRGFGYGMVGGANALVLNDEGFYAPPEPREGRLTAFSALPGVKLIAAEVADYYRPRYPVESMVRTSLLVRDAYYLVRDTVRTDGTPLRVDWQVFARGAVTTEGPRVHLATPEGVQLDIVPLCDAVPELTDAPNYPRWLEERSTRVRYRADGAALDLPFLLVPQRPLAPVGELTDGWTAVRAPEDAGLVDGVPGDTRVPAAEIGLAPGDGNDGFVWGSRTVTVDDATGRLYLGVASCVDDLRIWVNGQPAPLTDTMPGDRLTPALAEVTGLLRAGENTIVLAGPTTQGKLVNGAVTLYRGTTPAPLPEAAVLGPGHYRVGGDEIILAADGEIALPALAARASAVVLGADGGVTALQATRLAWGDVEFWSDRPLDVAFADGVVTLGALTAIDAAELRGPGVLVRVQSGGALDVDLVGPVRLVTTLAHETLVFVNGRRVDAARDPFSGRVEIADDGAWPDADATLPPHVRRMDALAGAGTAALLDALRDADWKVVMLATELLGRRGDPAATAPLLALLADESPERIYADDLAMWGEAVRRFNADPAPWSAGTGSSADAVKRHRVKGAVIEALGRLRAREAVPALCAILEDGREFYPVHSLACQALGRIGDPAALPALQKAVHFAEVNTKFRAADAVARLTTGRPAHPEYPDRSGL